MKQVLFMFLLIAQVSWAQVNPATNQAIERISATRTDIQAAQRLLPPGSPAMDPLYRADRNAFEAIDLVKRASEQAALPPKPFICIIVDGKGNVLRGEGMNSAEAQQEARRQCRLCGAYPTLHESCSARPNAASIVCQVIDGKGRAYNGRGQTDTDALAEAYRQCGVTCSKYPHTKTCSAVPN